MGKKVESVITNSSANMFTRAVLAEKNSGESREVIDFGIGSGEYCLFLNYV